MQARMNNPAMVLPDAMKALLALGTTAKNGGVPQQTLELVHLRASQINGCSFCVEMHARDLRKAGETDERLFAVAAWREAPYFTRPNAPRWRSPRPPPGSATGRTRFPTRFGRKPPGTTTNRRWRL